MVLRKLLAFVVLFAGILTPTIAFAQLTTVQGGTGTTSPSGILIGVTGNLHLQTLTVGTGLTLTGTTLTSTGGGGTPGGLNTQIQYNNNGSFGGISGAVTDGTAVSLTAAHLLNPTINGAGTGLATLTYPNTSTSVTITFPATTNTLATLAGSEALTNKSVNGVTLTTGGSATTYLNATGSYTTVLGTTTDSGIGHNLILYTNNSGVVIGASTSTLSIGGNAATATALQTGRTLSVTGDLAYTSPTFDGSSNVTAAGTLATVNSNVGSFTNASFTVNGKGLITAASSGSAPTTYTGSAPITVTGSVIGTSFSTSTFNSYTNQNVFTSLFATLASSTNATTTTLAITGGASNCNGSSALTTNSTGVVGCTAQPQGTVTAVSVASSNGFAGTSSGGATPALTITTSITSNVLKGNGTAIVGATNGIDYTLLSAQSCSAGSFVSALTAAGGSTCTAASTGSAYPFTPSTFGIAVSATTTPILDYAGFIAATSTLGTLVATSSITVPNLGVAAGQFAAFNAVGQLIGTSTPSGSNSAFSPAANYATTAGLPGYTYVAGVITETLNGALSVDGANPSVGQNVLVKNESGACTSSAGACNNGLYTVTVAGSGIAAFVLTRNSSYNSSSNVIPGIVTYIISGTVNADDFWAMTSASPITIGVTSLNYTEVAGGGSSLTSIGPLNQSQTGPAITLATTTSTTNGLTSALTITATGNTVTFQPSQSGTLAIGGGGTNATSYTTNNNAIYFDGTRLITAGVAQTVTTPNASTTALTVDTYFRTPIGGTTGAVPANVATSSLIVNAYNQASSSVALGDGTNTNNIFAVHSFSVVFASSTLTYYGGFATAGTTTTQLAKPIHSSILLSANCVTDVGTVYVVFGNGSATTTAFQCTTGNGATQTFSANNTWKGRQSVFVGVGDSASNPNLITITADVEDTN